MSIENIIPVILEGADLVINMLKENAESIGVLEDNIYRTYNPETEKDALEPNGAPVIIVYVQKATVEEIEEISSIAKNIELSVALMARVEGESPEVIDQLVYKFEKLQNVMAVTNLLKSTDGQGYQVTELGTADFVNLEFLQESNVVLCRLDFSLNTTVEGNFETYTDIG